jgi:cytochrome P450
MDVPRIDLTDAHVIRDPFTAYGQVRELSPVARTEIPGLGPLWVVTRHAEARAMLGDPRLRINATSFIPPDVPDHCRPYMRTMSERDRPEHARMRKLVSPAFTARRAEEFRPTIEAIVDGLLATLPGHGRVDLLTHFARPLPMDVICALVGVPDADRPRWREYGATVVAGSGQGFADAVPGIIEGARAAVAQRTKTALLDDLPETPDTDLITLVWHLVIAGQTPTNLIANAVAALLKHPDQLAALRADPALMPGAVEELIRWCGPALLTIPRYASEDLDLCGVRVREGEAVLAAIAAADRDPRVFDDPDRLDLTRPPLGHLGFAHGPHFCLGASLARVQTQVALSALLRRFPGLTMPEPEHRAPDPGTWRLAELPVTL